MYLLISSGYEFTDIHGIFDSLEKAKASMGYLLQSKKPLVNYISILKISVNTYLNNLYELRQFNTIIEKRV